MIKKQTTKKRKIIPKKEYVLWVVILILCVLQGASIWQIIKLQKRTDHSPDLSMRFLLKEAEEERYKYPIIDIAKNRVYIPEARIYLPLNESSRDMRYEFRRESTNLEASILYLSTSSVVGLQTGAQYESCDKMVTLASKSTSQVIHSNKVGIIQPTKDKMSDIYTHSIESCWKGDWYGDLRDDLATIVKEAKNY